MGVVIDHCLTERGLVTWEDGHCLTERGLVTWEDGRCNSPSYNKKGFSYLGRWAL